MQVTSHRGAEVPEHYIDPRKSAAKRITITLTPQQVWECMWAVNKEIKRLEKLNTEKPHKTFINEIGFQKRLYNDLAKDYNIQNNAKFELVK